MIRSFGFFVLEKRYNRGARDSNTRPLRPEYFWKFPKLCRMGLKTLYFGDSHRFRRDTVTWNNKQNWCLR